MTPHITGFEWIEQINLIEIGGDINYYYYSRLWLQQLNLGISFVRDMEMRCFGWRVGFADAAAYIIEGGACGATRLRLRPFFCQHVRSLKMC